MITTIIEYIPHVLSIAALAYTKYTRDQYAEFRYRVSMHIAGLQTLHETPEKMPGM